MRNKISLVGAGPGDYGLMTLKGAECLKRADVVVYDRLVNPRLLHLCKAGCEKIYVGKESGNHAVPQWKINEILLEKAKEGKWVVRLKGGDPYVFGRGGEEACYLLENGVDFEVVPGVTSAVAGPAYAGIPVTHRDMASSFHVFTGHAKENGAMDWPGATKLPGTLVFMMGLSNLEEIVSRLMESGKDPSTPAALIGSASSSEQRTAVSTLGGIVSAGEKENIASPAILAVGQTVTLSKKLNFFEKKRLCGKSIVLTRALEQSDNLAALAEEEGARALFYPALAIRDCPDQSLDNALRNMGRYSHVVFTSCNSVRVFFERMKKQRKDARSFFGIRICAVGSSTAERLRERGLSADLLPDSHTADGLWELMKQELTPKCNVLLPRAKIVRSSLAEQIRSVCSLEEIILYETLCGGGDEETGRKILSGNADWIVFASPSSVSNTLALLGQGGNQALKRMKIASIGPTTARYLENLGLPPACVSSEPGDEAVIKAILEAEGAR